MRERRIFAELKSDADAASEADARPDAPPRRRLPVLSLSLRLTLAACVIGILTLMARAPRDGEPDSDRARGAEARGAEIATATPFVPSTPAAPARAASAPPPGRLGLDDAEAIDPVRLEPARINPATAAREEAVTRGSFDEFEGNALRLTLTRVVGPDPAPSLFVTLARRAAEGAALAVIRTGTRGRVATKFGAVETMEATLAGTVRRICTGFATLETAPTRIDGWLCAPLGQPPEPRALACLLDALTLEGADEPAAGVFREAARRRDPACRPPALREAAEPVTGRTGSIRGRRAASAGG